MLIDLAISYKITKGSIEESDSNVFSEITGGKEEYSIEQAQKLVAQAAKAWTESLRADGWEVSAWDVNGNFY